MNFSFEGNYKPRRNINLGGVKKVEDKRSLMLKAQNERKAREQERLKIKNTLRIQAFYRGRKQASLTRHEQRNEFQKILHSAQFLNNETLLQLTRQLVLFYQIKNDEDCRLVDEYIAKINHQKLKDMFHISNKREAVDSWVRLCCLMIKKVLLPNIENSSSISSSQFLLYLLDSTTYFKGKEDENRIHIITFTLYYTKLLDCIKHSIMNSDYKIHMMESILMNLVTFYPPYYYSTSSLIEKYAIKQNYMTRANLLRMLLTELFTVPFLLDNMSDKQIITQLTIQLPFKDLLETITTLFIDSQNNLDDLAIAGLLINITTLGDTEDGQPLEGDILTNYAKVIQLLLTHLPTSYFTDPLEKSSIEIMNQESDLSDEEEDIEMEEVSNTSLVPSVSPLIKERLESIYDSKRIRHLLYQFMQLVITHKENDIMIESISSFFNTLILRWPTKKDTILNTLLYKSLSNAQDLLLPILWSSWSKSLEAQLFNDDCHIISRLSEATQFLLTNSKGCWSILYLLCEVYGRLLLTMADDEFLDKGSSHIRNPLELTQVVDLSRQLKTISFVMFWRANSMDLTKMVGLTSISLNQLRSTVTHLLQHIHMRDSRRRFCPKDHWLIPHLDTDDFSSEAVAEEFNLESEQEKDTSLKPLRMLSKGRLAIISPRLGLLNNIPFVIPFEQRVEIFRMFVNNDKKRNHIDEFYNRPNKASATVRRNHIFEDGFNALHTLGIELKNKIFISFVDEFGLEEAGIDGGGVFKEFLTGITKEAFNTNYGLFTVTSEQLLYPNPTSYATESEQLEYFKFLGLIIGKAVYEGILLDVAFADFFLKKCLGQVNYLDDLSSLDPDLYKGLLAVKNYEGNVEDLSLDFTSTHFENDGTSTTVDLIPGGSHISVTNQNRIQYIYSVANYRLNVQIARQCRAFFKGLSTIIDIKWLRMFNQQELQILLGGASVPIDLADLRAHTVLAGYMEHDKTVKNFWKALESFDNTLRMKFVKFVTSCSRPPLLGFKELVPQFCLRNAGMDPERLPTSSTCVNLLKLPNYPTYEVLREKLLYAINADAGFDLS
ncbi:uncharacterized protein BX663DRAFT_536455 [Cokeromyces recurvatus]|uniref:uncharacterized protein n=1 Tax=Cokeromyces recurvatus TaxID=90255 RepID=UPI00221EE8CA|nr:uncharacterized protein BX663DRAFT_536455 [Cokeromyces recurvatus]KAI7903093.1 hypothetical protein BX663DRAFT_536455 [Cokeromyces recurvatus]